MRAVETVPADTTPTEDHPRLSEAAAEAWIPRSCFKNGPPNQIGVELELLVVDAHRRDGPTTHYPNQRFSSLVDELSRSGIDGLLTVEPGGQVELSSRPGVTLAETIDVVQRDLSSLRSRAARHGARLIGAGVDPFRPPRRTTDNLRYAAMESYLDRWGTSGRLMMSSTASVQINVEAGVDGPVEAPTRAGPKPLSGTRARWDLLHAIGPALIAAFANSSWSAGRPTGWKSYRQAIWMRLDPARTGVPPTRPGECLEASYARWALDAPLMMVRRDHGSWTAPVSATFRDWLRCGRTVVPDRPPPNLDDLSYHLTTLFPQVRPKGYFEVRFIDAQPGPWWVVPAGVIGALLGDETLADKALDACLPVADRWQDAARVGLEDTELGVSAQRVLQLAAEALAQDPVTKELSGSVAAYFQRWTERGRCPADDPPEMFDRAPANDQYTSSNGEGQS